MALPAKTHWRVRAGGNALNGGGFCPGGSGTDYSDFDTPILSPTDLATTGAVTTVTSAAGGFTVAMEDNIVRIASGTNAIPGYYRMLTYVDANTFVLDRTPASGAMSGGVGRVGGAFATPWGNLATWGTAATPAITSPLAPGHTVWVRGAGTNDPGTAYDYDMGNAYAGYPSGSLAVGRVRWRGYNGRPLLRGSMLFYGSTYLTVVRGICVMSATSDSWPAIALLGPAIYVDCMADQNGMDKRGSESAAMYGVVLRNSGSSAAGTQEAVFATQCVFRGVEIRSWRGPGANFGIGQNVVSDSAFANCGGYGASVFGLDDGYKSRFFNCAFYGNSGDGLSVNGNGNPAYEPTAASAPRLFNNVFVNNGGYGINCPVGTSDARNEGLRDAWDFNAFYGNASGEMNGYETFDDGSSILLSADPFIDGANGDFDLNNTAGAGALLRAVAFPDF